MPLQTDVLTDKICLRCNIDKQKKDLLKVYLQNINIHKLLIRDLLCQEKKSSRQAYYLLQGSINLVKTLQNGQRIVLCQIGKDEFLNLQLAVNKWKNKYSIVVASSFIKFIKFQEKEVILLTENIIEGLKNIESYRHRQMAKKNKRCKDQEKKRSIQQHVNRLILPEINEQTYKRPSMINLVNNSSPKSLQKTPSFSQQLSKQLKSIAKSSSSLVRFYSKSIQTKPKNQMPLINYQDYKDKLTEKKLQRLKSERSVEMNIHEKQPKEYDYTRNEVLFKENLKNIVKRKLLFERKHYKVMTNYQKQNEPIIEQQYNPQTIQQTQNFIDNYFDYF